MIKILRFIARLFVGAVFIFSGFVKVVDPLGYAYKIGDYFTAFGIGFFEPIALPLAIIISAAEFIIGIALLLGIRMKEASWAVFVFMLVFTPLTLYLAIENPVSDCGCFGDAIILTNWQTFYKNLVILAFVLIVFFLRGRYKQLYSKIIEWGIVGFFSVFIIGLSIYCYTHLPILDFRPYSVGTNIPEKMKIPDGAPKPEYEVILKYKKDGEIKEFTMDSLPDDSWEWVETKSVLISEGYETPIHDFTMEPQDGGNDITDIVLQDNRYSFLLIAYDLQKAQKHDMERINKLADFCRENEYRFICLTASLEDDITEFRKKTGAAYDFYFTDEITLKTIVRSNPGLILLKDGVIIDKWHVNDIPDTQNYNPPFVAKKLTQLRIGNENQMVLLLILGFGLLVFGFRYVYAWYRDDE